MKQKINLSDFLSITELASEEIVINNLDTKEYTSLLHFGYNHHISRYSISNITMSNQYELVLHVEKEVE